MSSGTPQHEFVTDTMGLVLHLEKRKFSQRSKTIFAEAESSKVLVYIPAIVIAEILYLSEKKRIGLTLQIVHQYLSRFSSFQEYPLNYAIVNTAAEITDIPELHDRLIAGTARYLNLSLITNDPVIEESKFLKTIW